MKALTPVQQKFILHWGEMGTRWGINRTVAQVHALLFVSPKALNAEEIYLTLSVALSHVSTSLQEAMEEAGGGEKEDEYAREQLAKILEFFEAATACYANVGKLPPATLRKLMKMGGKVGALLG